MIAADVALAFNGVNDRKTWSARPFSKDGTETVHFTGGRNNIITLVLECDTGRFQVRFNRMHAAWGDYVTAIARAMCVVLSTLKAAGLPFEAPLGSDGIEIVATSGTGATYARWPGQTPPCPVTAIMPEIRTPEIVEEVKDALSGDA